MSDRSLLVIAWAVALTVIALHEWRQHLMIVRPLLPIIFDHHDHGAVKCATCHHNFFDNTGRDACYFCHKIRPALAVTIERDFHRFCRDCHQQIAARGIVSGPLRRCAECHTSPVSAREGASK